MEITRTPDQLHLLFEVRLCVCVLQTKSFDIVFHATYCKRRKGGYVSNCICCLLSIILTGENFRFNSLSMRSPSSASDFKYLMVGTIFNRLASGSLHLTVFPWRACSWGSRSAHSEPVWWGVSPGGSGSILGSLCFQKERLGVPQWYTQVTSSCINTLPRQMCF